LVEYCEPSLVAWLVEELLDSQTIDGCRKVFDYLESRRDRITGVSKVKIAVWELMLIVLAKQKHFDKKKLVILRACNELLRRLSRAEDTVFCGRVFIFLFQSFPLGDRSSVNLRGEYHVENATIFEKLPLEGEIETSTGMEVDEKGQGDRDHNTLSGDALATAAGNQRQKLERSEILTQNIKNGERAADINDAVPSMDALYATFWSLQESFSRPVRLFDDTNLEAFKDGLKSTIHKFKDVQQEQQARGQAKHPEESRRGVKRKRNGQEDELASTFNPKYLTSRDLFELEVGTIPTYRSVQLTDPRQISDLSFRRHILVQSLILVDFLLSLTAKAKKKLESTSNKSVLYGYTLDEENVS